MANGFLGKCQCSQELQRLTDMRVFSAQPNFFIEP